MKCITHIGYFDIDPAKVTAIRAGNVINDPNFSDLTHQIEYNDPSEPSGHHVLAISAKDAVKLSRLSGIKIQGTFRPAKESSSTTCDNDGNRSLIIQAFKEEPVPKDDGTIITKCDKCGSDDLEFEENSVGCRKCNEVIYEKPKERLAAVQGGSPGTSGQAIRKSEKHSGKVLFRDTRQYKELMEELQMKALTLELEKISHIIKQSSFWDRRGWDKWAELHPDFDITTRNQLKRLSQQKLVVWLDQWEHEFDLLVQLPKQFKARLPVMTR